MLKTLRIMVVLLLLLSLLGMSHATTCSLDTDCPGHQDNSFCTNVLCMDGTCIQTIAPCIAQCNDQLRKCVTCNTNDDCGDIFEICDQTTHECRVCNENADCSSGSFCYGGQWACVGGHCYEPPPSARPCFDIAYCDTDGKKCRECISDIDCGTWDYCENPRHCNVLTGMCTRDNNITDCSALGLKCRSDSESCVECHSHQDCLAYGDSFCEPLNTCNVNEGLCSWDGTPPCVHTNTSVTYCNENRKMCVDIRCHDEIHEQCDDGNDCNGKEICLPSGNCRSALVQACPNSAECDADQVHCKDPREGMACIEQRDCSDSGFVCRIVSEDNANQRECVRCRTDAQCTDGDFSNGEEICNLAIGKCEASDSPCAGAQIQMDYNAATGQCDLDVGLIGSGINAVTNRMKSSLFYSPDGEDLGDGEITVHINETVRITASGDEIIDTSDNSHVYIATVVPATIFDNKQFRIIFGVALALIIFLVAGGLYISSDTRCCVDAYSRRKKKKSKLAQDEVTQLSDSLFDEDPITSKMKNW